MSVNKIYEKQTTYEYSASVYHYHLLIIIKSMIATRHQYEISAVVLQTLFRGGNVGCFIILLFKEQMYENLASTASPQFHPLLPIHCFPGRSAS